MLSAGLPVAQAWLGKLIIDGVVAGAKSGTLLSGQGIWIALQPVAPYLALELAAVTLGALLNQGRAALETAPLPALRAVLLVLAGEWGGGKINA